MRLFSLFAVLLVTSVANANQNWPEFRGPSADGHADATGLPLTWSESENIVWKVPVHDRGWSSPLVWGKQVWMTSATVDGHQMYAICVDRETGKTIHDIKVFDNENLDHIAVTNSYASPTGVLEEGRAYVHYGTYGTACLDSASGQKLWERRDLRCDHQEGAGSSLMLWGDLLIFNVDGRDVQYVIALNKKTGQDVWKTNRSIEAFEPDLNRRKAYCTPIVIETAGNPLLVSPGAKAMMGYNPLTGEELWRVHYGGWSIAPRPLFGQGMIYFIDDYDRPSLKAVRPDGRGDVSDTHVAWTISKGMPNRPSPILVGDLLFVVSSDGIASCIEATTGETIWKHRIGDNFSASPIESDGHIYLFDEGAGTTVIEAGREFKVLGTSKLNDESMFASPAVAGKSIYLRTATQLYRIEQKN